MTSLGLDREVIDGGTYRRTVEAFRSAGILLPTFAQLAAPRTLPAGTRAALREGVQADAADPRNLFRVHWYNDLRRTGQAAVPVHILLPNELTGVDAKIVVALGDLFPMIRAHKVLAAYGCLAPRIITGAFDPTADRAVWPSTGNYCRGGVAISRLMGCRGVAVLPEGMSRERFAWLEDWVTDPGDIIRTPGTESNVKEIYDTCAELEKDKENVIINQFSEFPNYLIHYYCTGAAFDAVFKHLKSANKNYRLAGFVAATGSAGTLAAGDRLKELYGTKIVAVEALECPTMLNNGYGEHNIQGIGDKHIPLIHNIMNTDVVAAVSDGASDALNLLFAHDVGRKYLVKRKKVDPEMVQMFDNIGLSGFGNIVAAIKLARRFDYGANDVIMTVATDSAAMYDSERQAYRARHYAQGFDEVDAGELFGRYLGGIADDHVLELTSVERKRIFNLGYYTWVEQQGVSIDDFDRRKSQDFWRGLVDTIPAWDRLIEDFNDEVSGANA